VTGSPAAPARFARNVLGAWADLRGSMRAELAREPGEARLLYYAMLSGLLWFLGRAALLAWGPAAPVMPEDEFVGSVTAAFVGAVFFRTLALYGLAGIAGLIARKAGGRADWRETRAAVFWAALVAAPVTLGATLLAVLLADVPGEAAPAAQMLGAIAFAWALAHCLAEAHGFARAWAVLAVIAGLAVLAVALVYALLNV